MKKIYKKILQNTISQLSTPRGFSIIEVILAVAVFITFATAAVVTLISGFNANRLGAEFTIANQFASEGIEAVRSIKNQAYANLVNTTGTGVDRNGTTGVWQFGGANDTMTVGKTYTRVIKVESVNRDSTPPNGNIVASGGTTDTSSKKVTSTVTWNFNSARPESLSLVSYLSYWEEPIISGGPTMMAYSKTTSTPFYRIWDGSSWGAEASAQNAVGNINHVVLKSSRTRNEAILGTMDSSGNIHAQVWNGSTWSTPTLIGAAGLTLASYRPFDIDYEKNGDRAVIVYQPNAVSADPAYRIWNGSSWSAETTITTPPTTGVIRWISLSANPLSSSNDIAMIMLDANADVYGMVWNGSTWGNMGTSTVWDATAATADRKVVAVAYEQTSGEALFIWGDSVATDQYYRTWNGTTLSAATLLDIPAAGGVASWIRLVPRPNSNELLYGVVDAGADLNTRKWSGSAWDTATQHAEHSAAVENVTSMVFDLVWETHSSNPGEAWLVWGNGTAISTKQWSGTAWGAASTLTGSDDTSFIRLKADPSGAVFAGIYEDFTSATDDIWESRLTGGSSTWTAKNIIWGGATGATPVFFRIDIAAP